MSNEAFKKAIREELHKSAVQFAFWMTGGMAWHIAVAALCGENISGEEGPESRGDVASHSIEVIKASLTDRMSIEMEPIMDLITGQEAPVSRSDLEEIVSSVTDETMTMIENMMCPPDITGFSMSGVNRVVDTMMEA